MSTWLQHRRRDLRRHLGRRADHELAGLAQEGRQLAGCGAIAWSLIPLAAYLTNSVLLIGRIASAIARFAGAFVFSPKTWAGVIVLAVAVLLFPSSGGLPLLQVAQGPRAPQGGAAAGRADEAVGQGAGRPAAAAAVTAPRRQGGRAARG